MSPSGLVDFHCHLDLYPDIEAAIREADNAGVFTLAVTTTPRAWPRNHELAQRTKYVRAALGFHPQLVSEIEHELVLWERYLPEARYVGEIGLDAGPRFYKSFDSQKRVFQHILSKCAEAGDKIITVHSVRSVKTVLEYLEKYLPVGRGKVVLHWFTGTKSEAKKALELGCYFSINAEMLKNERHLSMVLSIPKDRLLTETDGPFTKFNGRTAVPKDVASVVKELALLHDIGEAQMAELIRINLRQLVS